jgi:hypothetical protein
MIVIRDILENVINLSHIGQNLKNGLKMSIKIPPISLISMIGQKEGN